VDSTSAEREREIKAPSKSDRRGVVFRQRQRFSSCPMPELEAALVVTGNESHNPKPEAHGMRAGSSLSFTSTQRVLQNAASGFAARPTKRAGLVINPQI